MKSIAKVSAITAVGLGLTLVLGIVSSRTVRAAVSTLVQVANTTANPVPTQAVDNPARHAVVLTTQTINLILPDGTQGADETLSDANGTYTVPAGQRLVVESFSGQMYLPVGTNEFPASYQVLAYVNGVPGLHDLVPVFISSNASYNYYAFTYPLNTYADPGTQVTLSCGRGPATTGTAICSGTLSGHLESVQ